MSKENNILKLPDGRKLGYAEYGNPKGKPIFFFHGWPSSRLQIRSINDLAKNLNIRIIAPDRPGFGLSDYKNDRTLLGWPDDMVSIADFLKINKFAVIGQSGGGPYAAVCAYKIPQRLTKVAIVVGLGPTNIDGVLQGMGYFNALSWKYYNKFPILMNLASSLLFLQAKKIFPNKPTFSFKAKSDQILLTSPKLQQELTRNRIEAFRQGKKGCALELKLYTGNWGFRLSDIKTKVYLWYGAMDKNVSIEMGKYYASQIPNSKLIIFPDEGHLIFQKHAEEILNKMIK
jgi:pimeloyl-ACP methyl ester carboxylesterase